MGRLSFTIIVFVVFARELSAQEYASLPYREIRPVVDLLTNQKIAAGSIQLSARRSKSEGHASREPLKLWIENNGSRTEIIVAKDGKFTLPMLEEASSTNAILRSNQPKGELVLSLVFVSDWSKIPVVKVDQSLAIKYEDLFAWNLALADFKELLVKQSVSSDWVSAPRLKSVVLSRENSDASVHVELLSPSKAPDLDIKINPFNGGKSYRVPFDEFLADEPYVLMLHPISGWVSLSVELDKPKPPDKEAATESPELEPDERANKLEKVDRKEADAN